MLVHQFAEYYARNFPHNPCLTQAGHTTSYGEQPGASAYLFGSGKDRRSYRVS